MASRSDNSLGLNLSMVRNGKKLKGKANPGGNSVRTMMSFLSDDDNYLEDSSWRETEELTRPTTSPAGSGQGNAGGGGGSLVLHNMAFDEEASDHEQLEMRGAGGGGDEQGGKKQSIQKTSDF